MAQINRLKAAEISDGNVIAAADIEAELDQLVNESNSQDTRLDDIEDNNLTLAGVKTFSSYPKMDGISEKTANAGVDIDGVLCKDGYVNVLHASNPASPAEGDVWYDDTANLLKYRNNSATKTVSAVDTLDDLSDVTITGAAAGNGLYYNGSAWVNLAPYESSGQTITSAGGLTLAHGRGATPKRLKAYIKCTSAEGGYSIGDEVPVPIGITMRGTTQAIGFSVVPDAINLNVRFADDAKPFFIANKTTGASFNCTNGSWQLYIRAWLY